MCIFLCLGDSCLCHIVCCKKFAKCIRDAFFYKCNHFIWNCLIILCKTYISSLDTFSSVKSVKIIRTECSGDFSCSIRAEIKEDHRISVFYSCNRCTVFCHYKWYYEFVSYFFVVRSLDSFCCWCCCVTFAACKCCVCFFYTVPTVVTVHCIVTSGNTCNFTYTDFFHLCF